MDEDALRVNNMTWFIFPYIYQKKVEDNLKKREKMKENTETVFTKNVGGSRVTLDDFEILKVLGRGAFGKVNKLNQYHYN